MQKVVDTWNYLLEVATNTWLIINFKYEIEVSILSLVTDHLWSYRMAELA